MSVSACSDAMTHCKYCDLRGTPQCYTCEDGYEVNSDNLCSLPMPPCKSVYGRAKSFTFYRNNTTMTVIWFDVIR